MRNSPFPWYVVVQKILPLADGDATHRVVAIWSGEDALEHLVEPLSEVLLALDVPGRSPQASPTTMIEEFIQSGDPDPVPEVKSDDGIKSAAVYGDGWELENHPTSHSSTVRGLKRKEAAVVAVFLWVQG